MGCAPGVMPRLTSGLGQPPGGPHPESSTIAAGDRAARARRGAPRDTSSLLLTTCGRPEFMFGRLNQLARHLTRPLPNYAHRSAATTPRIGLVSPIQTSSAMAAQGKSMIHTAACLIIGDEVLGGKVSIYSGRASTERC